MLHVRINYFQALPEKEEVLKLTVLFSAICKPVLIIIIFIKEGLPCGPI